jgi:hypothetical protein
MTDDWMPSHIPMELPVGDEWSKLRALLAGDIEAQLFSLKVTLRAQRAVLEGSVFSEEVKAELQRLVFLNTSVVGVDNLLSVNSPLYSAGDDFDGPPTSGEESGTPPGPVMLSQVTRYPDIRTTAVPQPGSPLDIVADLGMTPSLNVEGKPVVFDVDADWDTLEIDVEIHSWQLDIADDQRRKVIQVRRDRASVPALFSGVVKEDAGQVDVELAFFHAGRFSGAAKRTLEIVKAPIAEKIEISAETTGGLSIDRSAKAPSLTVKIMSRGGPSGECVWAFDTAPHLRHIGASNQMCTSLLGQAPQEYFNTKFRQCPQLPAGTHVGTLRGIGELIWDVVPKEFGKIYKAIQDVDGPGFPIQILTNEPAVPWELMFVQAAVADREGHLALKHPLARWILNEGPPAASYRYGQRLSFAPEYPYNATLPAAREEGEWLATTFGAQRSNACFADFMNLLTTPPAGRVQLVHFAGHGASQGDPNAIGLKMADHWVTVEQINSSVTLGNRDAPLFILNACQVGSTDQALGSVAGWPPALAKRAFGGVIAPLWSVQDKPASLYVRSLLTALLDQGATIGTASLQARLAYQQSSASAYAYLTYGDVMATAERQS